MIRLNSVDWIAMVLVIIGAINWGLVSFGFNLVNALFGWAPTLETIIYLLVGLAGLWLLYALVRSTSEHPTPA